MTYSPDYVPTGPNNKANEYYKKINNVRIAKTDYNRTEFFGTIGGNVPVDTLPYTLSWNIGGDGGAGIHGYQVGTMGALKPTGIANGTTSSLASSTSAFPDALIWQFGGKQLVDADGSLVTSLNVTTLGVTVERPWLGDPNFRYQGASVGIRNLIVAARQTTVPFVLNSYAAGVIQANLIATGPHNSPNGADFYFRHLKNNTVDWDVGFDVDGGPPADVWTNLRDWLDNSAAGQDYKDDVEAQAISEGWTG